MSIYAIADLHLSFSVEKPMDIYGGEWVGHTEKLKDKWEKIIMPDDIVIIPGDISWALKYDDALIDLKWISRLPGKKVFVKGNHDLWWNSINKLNKIDENLFFLQNSYYIAEGYAICGSRGWVCPGDDDFTQHDDKIYKRELGRLKLSLEEARRAGYGALSEGESKGDIIGVLHFPPTNDKLQPSGFTELFEKYGVKKVIYGHLHGKDGFKNGLRAIFNGVEYMLVSLDYLKCTPRILVD
ncbi:metallophosphoesterase [Anaerovorax odorimutans]|uniref:metallophosphoesterase n=1 Tax=Anaerovorax odorimutans TaxID=109327 RepID=UPI0003FCB9D6|nr:metallophosphoesterase [Anaerovorax odorimutans]